MNKIFNILSMIKKMFFFLILFLLASILFYFDLVPSFSSDFSIKGIDISHYNRVNFNKVKKHFKFCIIKATQGKTFKDPKFYSNWRNCKKNNIIRGAYHFFQPGISANSQFLNYKNRVKLLKNDLPPILDVENKECDVTEVNKWMQLAEDYYGVKPILYSEYSLFKVFLENKINKFPLWIYLNHKYFVKPSFNNFDCLFWQYDHRGKIKGSNGNIDLDVFLGEEESFKKF